MRDKAQGVPTGLHPAAGEFDSLIPYRGVLGVMVSTPPCEGGCTSSNLVLHPNTLVEEFEGYLIVTEWYEFESHSLHQWGDSSIW